MSAQAADVHDKARHRPAGSPEPRWPEYAVDGATGEWLLMPVGDWGVSEVQVRTVRDGCPYVFWLPAETTEDQARAIVSRW